MSVRVTKVSRNSLTSRPETVRSETDNDNKNINEQQVNKLIFHVIVNNNKNIFQLFVSLEII